jgi:hypothetical protein
LPSLKERLVRLRHGRRKLEQLEREAPFRRLRDPDRAAGGGVLRNATPAQDRADAVWAYTGSAVFRERQHPVPVEDAVLMRSFGDRRT